MKIEKSKVLIIVLAVLLAAAIAGLAVCYSVLNSLQSEADNYIFVPKFDPAEVYAPEDATVCGICSNCHEFHFVWEPRVVYEPHICDEFCDHLSEYFNQDIIFEDWED